MQDTDYNVYRHGLENSLCTGYFDFVVNPYFSFWHTVHAMLGVLGDLLQKSFKKADTSRALPEGTVAYDLYVKGGEDDNQRIGRLFLELARRLPAGGFKARSEEPWGGKCRHTQKSRCCSRYRFLFSPPDLMTRTRSTNPNISALA